MKPTRNRRTTRGGGFTLIELMIVLVIIGILAAIAYPSYISYITHSRRSTAEACLSNYADYMERFYATNLRYDKDTSGTVVNLPSLDCASTQATGKYYSYDFDSISQTGYTIEAVPQGIQATRDASCGTLSLTQTGVRGRSGTENLSECWGQ